MLIVPKTANITVDILSLLEYCRYIAMQIEPIIPTRLAVTNIYPVFA